MAPGSKGPAVSQKPANGSNVPSTAGEPPTVNRKKQKRREKQAAKLAAEQQSSTSRAVPPHKQNGHPPHAGHEHGPSGPTEDAYDQADLDEQYEDYDYGSDGHGHSVAQAGTSKSKKKKKRARGQGQQKGSYHDHYAFHQSPPPPLRDHRPTHALSKDRIWNTSTAEERERIKEFWLSLEEVDRRSLVKVEKEAVLKKMKEQQRNSCSCTVCGRKRTAIEEELETLYDAYYDELEQYAHHQQSDGTAMPPPGVYPSMRSRVLQSPHLHGGPPPRGRITEEFDEEEGDEEVYSEEEEDSEDYDDFDEPRVRATEFFNFGNSLTVQGGILTVADDLLKNDGKKFIEMMEQLAERRMAREQMHSRFDQPPMRQPSFSAQDQGPPLDDEEDYEDDEGDYDDSQDDYDEDEEMEGMSEEQRMEEGRRMFQIFAARMFEQRVLTAYREKVAKERQERLIEELDDEDALKAQREAKKAKEAQKKKDKKKQQKAAKEEERLKREAEKAAELAAAKALEEKKLEEQRLKKEEQRKKKEAEKKAQEEEKQKKEAERQQRIREQQAESERKQREAKEKEKKRKEETKKKEREERERELKAKKDKEAAEKQEREAKVKAQREASEASKKEESTKPTQPVPVVPSLSRKTTAVVPTLPPGLQSASSVSASPHLQVATPAIPKAPSPVKPRQTSQSQQDSHQSSPKSSQGPSDASSTSTGSVLSQPQPPPGISAPNQTQHPAGPQHHIPTPIGPPPGIHSPHYPAMSSPGLPGSAFAQAYSPAPGMPPRFPGPEPSMYGHQPIHAPFRPYPTPANFGYPPGFNIPRQNHPQGRGSPIDMPSTQAPIGSTQYMTSHSRQHSGSYERHEQIPGATAPIARPNPIERPSSLPHQDDDVDEMSNRLGSSALLDSSEDNNSIPQEPRGGMAPGVSRQGRVGFGASPIFPDPLGHPRMNHFGPGMPAGNTWGAPQMPMGTPSMSHASSWSAASGSGWSNNAFGTVGSGSSRLNPAHLRSLACRACRQLSAANAGNSHDDFHSVDAIIRQMEQMKGPNEGAIDKGELLKVLDAEGSAQNGGGYFDLQSQNGVPYARYEQNNMPFGGRLPGPPGEIGSPIIGNAMPFGQRNFPVGSHPGGPGM